MSNKKYKLLKDLPYAKKGAIYNVDNNGNYVTMDVIDNPIVNHDTLHKHTVENNPEWFELITEPSIQPEVVALPFLCESEKESEGSYARFSIQGPITNEQYESVRVAITNVLSGIVVVEDKPFGGGELVRLLRDCVSSTWGNTSLTETQLLFDKFLYDRKLAKPTPQLINSFITDYVNRNVYDKKYSQSEVDAMMEDYGKKCFDAGRDRVGGFWNEQIKNWQYKSFYDYKVTLPLQQKTFTAPLSLSEHPKCKNEDNSFVWTDELVLEWSDHVRDIFNNPNNNYCGKYDGFDTDFKKWKQSKQPSTTVKPEWEIVDYGYTQNNENKPEQRYINSVKRLSDGEVFSIGDMVDDGMLTLEIFANKPTRFVINNIHIEGGNLFANGSNIKTLTKVQKSETTTEPTTEPTEDDLKSPEFNAVWNAIKKWDIDRGEGDLLQRRNYSGATGTDVMTILNALKSTNK